jgi:hypothetical protein
MEVDTAVSEEQTSSFSETFVSTHEITRRQNQEYCDVNILLHENLKIVAMMLYCIATLITINSTRI